VPVFVLITLICQRSDNYLELHAESGADYKTGRSARRGGRGRICTESAFCVRSLDRSIKQYEMLSAKPPRNDVLRVGEVQRGTKETRASVANRGGVEGDDRGGRINSRIVSRSLFHSSDLFDGSRDAEAKSAMAGREGRVGEGRGGTLRSRRSESINVNRGRTCRP